jgi:hypothetical protein
MAGSRSVSDNSKYATRMHNRLRLSPVRTAICDLQGHFSDGLLEATSRTDYRGNAEHWTCEPIGADPKEATPEKAIEFINMHSTPKVVEIYDGASEGCENAQYPWWLLPTLES